MAETTIKIPRLASSQKVPQANQLSHTKIDDLSNVQQAQDDTNDRKQVEDDKHPSPKDHEEGVDEEDEQQEKPVIKEVKEQNKLKRRTRHGRSASHTPSTSPSRAPGGPAREEDVLKGRGSHTPIPRNKSDIVLRRNRSGGSLLMGNSKAASKPGPKTRTKGGISGTRRSVLMDQSSKKGSSKGVMEQDQSVWGSEGLQQDDEGEWIEASNSPSPEVSRAHSRRGSARPQPNHQQDEDRAEQLDRTFLRGQKGDGQDSPGKETRLPPSTHFVPTIPPSRIPGDSFEAQLSHSRPPSLLSPTGLHKSPKPDISAKMGANQSREEAKARQGFGPNPQRKDRGPSLNLLDGLKQGSNLKAGPSAALSGTTIVNDVSSGQHYLQQPLEDDGEGMTSSFLRFPKDEDDYAHSSGGMKGETMKGSSAVGLISKAVADIPKPTPSPPQHSAQSSVGKHKGASSSYTSNQGFNRTQRKLLLERELVENEAKRQALALKREQKLEAKRERQMKIRDGDTVKYDIKESGVGSQADGSQNDTKPRSRMGGNGDGNASNASIDSASSGWLASSGASVSSTQTACIENSEQTMAELLREAAGHPEPGIIPVGGEDAAAELLAAHGLGRNPAKKQHRSSKPEHSAPPSAHWSTASTSGSTASHKQDATRIYREMLKHRHNELENSSRFVDPEKAMWDRLAKNDKFKALMKSDSKELTEEEELKLCIKMRFGIDVEIEDE